MSATSNTTTREVSGTIKWFNPRKGFGFVLHPDGKPDIFLHVSVLRARGFPEPGNGVPITCLVEEGPKGSKAVEVKMLNGNSPSA